MRRIIIVLCSTVLLLSAVSLAGAPEGVKFQRGEGRIDIAVGGRPFTTYYYSADAPKPYFHPLRAADGRIVTRAFPMEKEAVGEEKDRDHPHHRSCWFTFGDVDGVDYWSEGAKVQGRIVHRSIDKMKADAKKGLFAVTMDWVDNTGRKVLVQKQEVVIQGDAQKRMMDFTITLTAADRDVTFRDTKEGMFGIRVATPLKERNGGIITNSKGAVGMKGCWGKKAEWVDYAGNLKDSKVGIAIMDHPGNLRHPTTWHVRDYGLFAVNPFGLRDFSGDKSQDGSYQVKAGKDLTFRYRVLIHPGDTAAANIADEYQRYIREVK